jgi:hypothetical protein
MMQCPLTGLPILAKDQAASLGMPELAIVDAVFSDDSRLRALEVQSESVFGGRDLSEAIACDAVRFILSDFDSQAEVSFYDLGLNIDWDGEPTEGSLRHAYSQAITEYQAALRLSQASLLGL